MRNNRRQTEANKPERVPVSGLRDIMTVLEKDPDYEYRWVVDTDERGSRIMKYLRGGYTLSPAGAVNVGEDAVYKTKDSGSIIRLATGGGKYSYLMQIRKEWYDADRRAAQASIDETERSMRKAIPKDEAENNEHGQYGSVQIK